MIYFDNAATTLTKPPEVIRAVTMAMSSFGNSGRGAHNATLTASRTIYKTRVRLARLFGAESPERIVFTANATESLNIAIKGILAPGDHVIATQQEHNSVLRPLYELESQGIAITHLPCDAFGRIAPSLFEAAIQENTKAIICTHGSNLTGNLLDLTAIGQIAKRHHLLFLVDASQTAGVFPIDVQCMGIDLLCFTGHKSLMGPQGTGGLYVRTGVAVKPLLTGGSGIETFSKTHPTVYPTALEAGTLNGHGIAGLYAALSHLERVGIDTIRAHETALAKRFYDGVRPLPDVRLYGDFSTWRRCPIVTLNLGDADSAMVSDELMQTYQIATRSGGHCAPLLHQALGTADQGAVRFSFSYFNTEDEVDAAISALRQMTAS